MSDLSSEIPVLRMLTELMSVEEMPYFCGRNGSNFHENKRSVWVTFLFTICPFAHQYMQE
jgi:hypothetical protein